MAGSDVLRSRAMNIAHGGLGVFVALLGASALVVAFGDEVNAGALVFTALLPAGAWLARRSWRAGIVIGHDHVVIRGIFRTRRLDRTDLRAVRVESSPSLVPWRSLALDTVAGPSVIVYELSSFGSANGSVDDARRTLASWLAA